MKSLSIFVFLGILLFVLYAQNMEEKNSNISLENNSTVKYVKLIEKDELFTSSRKENMVVKSRVDAEEDVLKVDIGMDINTTRDTKVILTAYVENLEEEEGCNYFWRDGKKFLGVGDSISVMFAKGKHDIVVHIKTTEGREINVSKVITAWEYRKEAELYYSEKTGEFRHKKVRTYDYQDHLIQIKGKDFLKTYTYDKNGRELSMNYENYTHVSYSRSYSSEYDDNGNMINSESLDADGKVVWRETGEYNDENETISYKMGEDDNSLEEIMGDNDEYIEEESELTEASRGKDENEKYVYDDNDNLLKSEYSYGETKYTTEMKYNENNQTIEEFRTTKDGNYTYETRYKYVYDKDGNVITLENEQHENGKIYCHYVTTSTYNADGYVLTETNKVLSGDCSHDVYNLYVEKSYDKDGNIIDMKSKTYTKENEKEIKQEISEIHRTMKTEKYYSNDLDD